MCTLLYLAPFFLSLNLLSNDRKQKSVIDKEQTQKNIWKKIQSFLGVFLGDQNGHPKNDPRAYVLAEVSAGKGEREGETEKER